MQVHEVNNDGGLVGLNEPVADFGDIDAGDDGNISLDEFTKFMLELEVGQNTAVGELIQGAGSKGKA